MRTTWEVAIPHGTRYRLTSQGGRSTVGPHVLAPPSAARDMPELSCRQASRRHGPVRQHGLLRGRVDGSESMAVYRILRREGFARPGAPPRSGEAGHQAMRCSWLRVRSLPPEDHGAPPDVGHRCLLFQGGGLGLLLHGHRHGRLLTLHSGPQASKRYDIRLLHRSGPGGRGQDRHGPGADRRPDQAAERQRSRLCIPGLQGLPGRGRHQTHPGDALPPSDQRQAGALPPDPQT